MAIDEKLLLIIELLHSNYNDTTVEEVYYKVILKKSYFYEEFYVR